MATRLRINAFQQLGEKLKTILAGELEELTVVKEAEKRNPWFTPENQEIAFRGIAKMLEPAELEKWISGYDIENNPLKTIGVIMAGNIPMAGFHDFLCVLLSGNKFLGKLSVEDAVLLPYISELLLEIEPAFLDRIKFRDHFFEKENSPDAFIASGSNNSNRYFEHYLGKKPHLFRKTRTSMAVFSGEEKEEDLVKSGLDVFTYFGLGCRNVTSIRIPKGYDLERLMNAWKKYQSFIQHHKYANNYHYYKTVLSMKLVPFVDGGFFILLKNSAIGSPVSMVHFSEYKHVDEVKKEIQENRETLQCIVCGAGLNSVFPGHVNLGETQEPGPGEFADGKDTLQWLLSL